MSEQSNLTNLASQFDRWFQQIPAIGNISLMDHLFNRLDGAYPHKWRSNFPNQQAIDNWSVSWAEAFEEEGIKPEDIKAGLKACRNRFDWPPSCAEFIKSCKPAEKEITSLTAYYEAVAGLAERDLGRMGSWSHPAIFWASSKMAFDLKNQTFSQMKIRWDEEFNAQMSRGEWESIPKPMIALPAPGKGQTSNDEAKEALKKIGAQDIIKPRVDHKLWAKRIMSRLKKNDKYLSALQIRFAKEALIASDAA